MLLGALAAVGVGLAIFVAAGGVDLSADKPDGWLATQALHFVFKRSEASRSASLVTPADLASPYRVRLAAQHFDMVCANCHGRPGLGQSLVPQSMSPRPQYLPKVVGQFTDPELFEIVQHGVKYTGMPSWPTDRRPDEIWSMVAFLRQLPTMDAKTYSAMTALPQTANAPPAPPLGDPSLRPANVRRDWAPVDEFSYTAPASGFSDQTIHDNPVATCARCHGLDGSGAVTGGEAPNLTIHDAAYLRGALQAYTTGARQSGFMQNIAVQLSGPQIAQLADYYAGLPVKTPPAPPVDAALVQRGETIATQGVRDNAIPACDYCHESAGAKITGAPHIAGQSDTFLRRQLSAFRLGGRGSSVRWNPMSAVAHDLSDNDIAALAAYYSGLTPAKAAGGQAAPPPAVFTATGVKIDLGAAKEVFNAECVKCHTHGGRGDRAGGYPDLTLQTTPYVAQALYLFHTRARPNAQMRDLIDSLSLDDMTSLAQYVNGLTPQPALLKPDAAAAARGAVIAAKGAPDRGVPACLSCHGQTGVAALPLIPRLQGQSPLYLRNRLNNFAKPYNVNLSALNPMPSIAGRLTDQERADLAAYFAAASPLSKSAQP